MSMHDTGSVRSKLILMAVSTTAVALLCAGLAMLLLDLRTFQRYWIDDLTTQADIVASVTAPAVSFNDPVDVAQSLTLLRVRPQIVAAAVFTANGTRFATYVRTGVKANLPERPEPAGYRIERGKSSCTTTSSKTASASVPSTCARAMACWIAR